MSNMLRPPRLFSIKQADITINCKTEVDFTPKPFFTPHPPEEDAVGLIQTIHDYDSWGYARPKPPFLGYSDTFGTPNYFRMHVGVLLDMLRAYNYVHGSGIRYQGKGILLVGHSEHGKTTLTSLLSGETMDDDQLLVRDATMHILGERNCITRKEGENQYIIDSDPTINHVPIHAVYVLTKKHPGGYIVEQGPHISRRTIFQDQVWQFIYEEGGINLDEKILLGERCYTIGTNENPERTIEAIQSTL